MLFTPKREEANSLALFKRNCTYHGLNISVSMHVLSALKVICEHDNATMDLVGERMAHVLVRRGFARYGNDTQLIVTQAGLLLAALAEAGQLITVKGKLVPLKKGTAQ